MKLRPKLNLLKYTKMNKKANKRSGTRGVAAIEFALIAPVMIMMLFGATELVQAITIDRKVTLSASAIADLVTQSGTLDCTTFQNAVGITRQVFQPYGTEGGNAKIVIASVAMVDGSPKIEWSRQINSSGSCEDAPLYPAGTPVNVSGTDAGGNSINLISTMLNNDNTVIIGDVTLDYTSLGTQFLPGNIIMNERFFYRPRKSKKVCFSGISVAGC